MAKSIGSIYVYYSKFKTNRANKREVTIIINDDPALQMKAFVIRYSPLCKIGTAHACKNIGIYKAIMKGCGNWYFALPTRSYR